ncbi:hypothetical protein QTP70_011239 [Hemibagrus guttatus]|uniref:Uncharacterized protein n=1 Tax=Hemibagrus guttatus TaxID=175788 RepID=A0AAE0PRF3_9TELE|nr:hypothetical protein QTP70_011239 [Hemibagrus guttatus]KAK3522352.1 hypothetical protein QTP86_007642 [Hemibagrus guttatus]
MEDDEEDTPLPFPANPLQIADSRPENMPLIQTTPRFRNSGSVPSVVSPVHRSLHGAVELGFLSTPSGSTDDSLLHNLILFPGGDSGFTALVQNASEQSGEEDEQDEGKGEEREEDRTSVEVRIGRKLREIGDHFQQEHMQLISVFGT